jgi:hypothetical protein
MNFYDIEILDLKTGDKKRVETFCGWTQYSAALYSQTMCDCNLGACRDREIREDNRERSIQAHEIASYRWRELNGQCDHSMPPKRLKVTRAFLSDGRVYDFETGEYSKKKVAA